MKSVRRSVRSNAVSGLAECCGTIFARQRSSHPSGINFGTFSLLWPDCGPNPNAVRLPHVAAFKRSRPRQNRAAHWRPPALRSYD